MSKNVALVKVENQRDFYVPFGLMYVGDALRKAGFQPRIWHIHQENIRRALTEIQAFAPLFVGLSVMTGPQLRGAIECAQAAHELGLPVVWGGVHPTIMPKLVLGEAFVDYVVIGEGEITTPKLAESIAAHGPPEDIPGTGYKSAGRMHITPPPPLNCDLDRFEPAWDLVDVSRYYRREFGRDRVLPMITSRGCPYRCGFCYNQAVNQRRWRPHSTEFVLRQKEFLQGECGINGVYFHDDHFFSNIRRGKEIIEQLGLPYSAEVRADRITEDFARWLSESPCRRVFIGVESGSDRVLQLIQKDTTIRQAEQAVALLAKFEIPADLSFIIGFPGETPEERAQTLNFMDKLQSIHPCATLSVKIFSPYPGTPLWHAALEAGFTPPASNLAWSAIGRNLCALPWLDKSESETLSRASIYALAGIPDTRPTGYRLLAPIERWRWRKRRFRFPLEFRLLDLARKITGRE